MEKLINTNIPAHPYFVHFPIALIITATVMVLIAFFYKKNVLMSVAGVTIFVGFLGALAAIISGFYSANNINANAELSELLETHEHIGIIAGIITAAVLFMFIKRKAVFNPLEHFAVAIIMIILSAGIIYQAGLGGKMVYEFSAGIVIPNQDEYAFKNNFDKNENLFLNLDAKTAAKNIASAYGIDSFKNISSIDFSFNVKTNKRQIKRTWHWEPKTKKVVYKGPDKDGNSIEYTYFTNDTSKDNLKLFVDERFVNDQYWLLFPFHLIWDSNVQLTYQAKSKFPISHMPAHKLVVSYPNNVGYTPGDIYELFFDDNYFIKEWIYRSGGSTQNKRAITWEENKKFGPVTISTFHTDSDKQFSLWFSDIVIE